MKFGIIGSGSWATALAKILTDNQQPIQWWVRNEETINHIRQHHHNPHYLSSAYFDTSLLSLSPSLPYIIDESEVLVIAVPSAYLADILETVGSEALKGKKIVSAVKGILPRRNILLNEYLQERFGMDIRDYFAIMGPCHAEEVAAEKLSYLTFSGGDQEATAAMAAFFKTRYLRTIVNSDLPGVQYAAVLKNIYALGAGIAHGLEYGDNFLSVFIANSAHEMAGFLARAGEVRWRDGVRDAQPNYFASVYLGDLLVTSYSLFSRNRTFGNMIGKGYSVQAAQLEMNMVAEGQNASRGIYEINKSVQAPMPIAGTIYRILWEGLSARQGLRVIEEGMV